MVILAREAPSHYIFPTGMKWEQSPVMVPLTNTSLKSLNVGDCLESWPYLESHEFSPCFFGFFSSLKVIENMNLKKMVTSFYKLLLWPDFQDTPLIKQTIGSKLQEQVL